MAVSPWFEADRRGKHTEPTPLSSPRGTLSKEVPRSTAGAPPGAPTGASLGAAAGVLTASVAFSVQADPRTPLFPAQPLVYHCIMTLITTTTDLDAFCSRLAGAETITVDTEFM